MNATKYESTYCITDYAIKATSEVEKVIAKLKEAGRPITCKELGFMVYGDDYKRVPYSERQSHFTNRKAMSLTARINQVLRHMVEAGNVQVDEIKSEPYTYETKEWVYIDENNELETIEVWDAQGNKYDMLNPKYNQCNCRGEYRKVTKTGRKTIRTYLWVKD